MFSHACRVIAPDFYWHNLDEIAQLAHVYWNLLCCSRVLDLQRTGGRQKPDTKTVLFLCLDVNSFIVEKCPSVTVNVFFGVFLSVRKCKLFNVRRCNSIKPFCAVYASVSLYFHSSLCL